MRVELSEHGAMPDRTAFAGRGIRVVVVGGSLGGLTAALVLRRVGCEVDVFERSEAELAGYGAGIVVHAATVRYLTECSDVSLDDVSVSSRYLRYLGSDGSIVYEEELPHRFTAWSTVYSKLLALLGDRYYHRGEGLVGFDQDTEGVKARFASGRVEQCHLLVCADGILSTARMRLFPDLVPTYAGYVGWRGTLDEADLTPRTVDALRDALTYALLDHSHFLAYPIPNRDGGAPRAARLMNFVWYRNVAPGAAIGELMTDRHGFTHPVSLHPGEVQDHYVRELRDSAVAELPPPLAEIVLRTEHPFVQMIADVEVPRMAVGRVCLLGDAAFVARPHAAAGTAKAAENAWRLAEALVAANGNVLVALEQWDALQMELGRQLVGRAREIGERSQFLGTWKPGDPGLRFGLYGPGQ
jgi:2,6-dihydroxypyridine 3-monooxygenase